jgi:two-component system, NarL family, sensor histidine kinase DevS
MPERMRTSDQALFALNEAARAITSELELDKVLQLIIDAARELVGARYAALGAPDEKGELAQFIVSGIETDAVKRIPHPPRGLGLLGALLEEGRTIRIGRIQDDPRSVGFPAHHPPMSSFLGVPIRGRGGKVLGNLYLTEKMDADKFSAADEELIEIFAGHAAIAITNAGLFRSSAEREQELAERNRELAALNAVARATAQHLDLEDMLGVALDQVMLVIGMESAEIYLQEEETGDMVQALYRGQAQEAFGSIRRFKRGEGFVGHVAQTGLPIATTNLARQNSLDGYPPFLRQAVINEGFTSLVFTPLKAKHHVIGVLGLASRSHGPFNEQELALLEAIGHQVGVAVENARLYSRVAQLAVVEERARIGMDLHDGVIQSIYAVGLTLESIRLMLNGSKETNRLLSLAIDGLNDVIRDIRNFILDLRPQRFEGDLGRGLARLVREFQANAMVLVQLTAPPDVIALIPPKMARSFFMTAQEALANVARHARAGHVIVELRRTKGGVALLVSDDGLGFDSEEQAQMTGHGLANMRLRAASLHGALDIQSAPGQGTTIRMELPLRLEERPAALVTDF